MKMLLRAVARNGESDSRAFESDSRASARAGAFAYILQQYRCRVWTQLSRQQR